MHSIALYRREALKDDGQLMAVLYLELDQLSGGEDWERLS